MIINNIIKKLEQKKFYEETLNPIKEMGLIEDETRRFNINIKKMLKMITVIILSITLVFGIFWVCMRYQENIPSTTSVNLVSDKGRCTPAFLGYKFTPKLTTAIKDGEIELYGIYACSTQGHEVDCQLVETKEAVHGTIERLKIIKAEYIKYTDNYLNTYFSKEYVEEMRKEGRDGYWEYTIDIVD